ncbi:hypothetical protein DFJ43DRAFT_1040942 [Lentinula guzmanii]|uniref:Uncharacterized protein n=1 Tax=Lentinula guzmanii TaxID=2804957 RepID=A0AA38JGI2_9AGAR|nr:hypothetical protein DFJ43DRAFT_1040942 [Lentinula guzmanii]
MHFPVASFYVLLGLFAVGSSVPTGAKRLARLKLNQQTSFFAHSTYSVGDELKNVVDSTKPTVRFAFVLITGGWTNETARRPEAVAYAKSNAFLILQHAETVIGLERPYIVSRARSKTQNKYNNSSNAKNTRSHSFLNTSTDGLNFDPRNIPPPDFSSNTYATINLPNIVLEAEAQQHLRDQWEQKNGVLRAWYEVQLEEDQAIAEARNEEVAEEQRMKEAERKATEEAELAEKAEEKRTPLYSFKQGVGVAYIQQQIHQYAKKLMAAHKYVPLWVFPTGSNSRGEGTQQRSS